MNRGARGAVSRALFHARRMARAALIASALAATVAPAAAAEADCRGATGCRLSLPLGDGLAVAAYVSHRPETTAPEVRRLVIVVHGAGRNARGYYRSVFQAAQARHFDRTAVIAPRFAIASEAETRLPGEIFWRSNAGWTFGGASVRVTDDGPDLSSYAVVDRLIARAARRFPNLSRVVVVGHSAGGQLVQRYAVGAPMSDVERRVPHRFVVANPASYLYLDDRRARDDGSFRAMPGSRRCPVNAYKYGMENRVAYMSREEPEAMAGRYRDRDVVYLLGEADNDPRAPLLDVSCPAMAQGPHRLARGLTYKSYMDRFFAPHRHRLATVPGIGHSARAMFNSAPGVAAIFGP